MKIRILLVDDHTLVRKGLRLFLQTQSEIEIIGEAANGQEALDISSKMQPDVVLMDLSMPVMNGIETTKQIKTMYPRIKILILTSFSDHDHVLPALKAGADGFQLKEIEPDELVSSIKAVYQGSTQLHPQAASLLLSHVTGDSRPEKNDLDCLFHELTAREKDVLFQISLGKGNKEVAASLFITEKTVKTHVSSILAKLDLHDRTQAAIAATKNRWFE